MLGADHISLRARKRREYDKLKREAQSGDDILLETRAAVYAAKTDAEIQEKIADWVKARDALPEPSQRLLEDERAAILRPSGRRIPALQQQAVTNILKDLDALSDPVQRVTVSMLAFHYAPSGSAVGQDALASVFKYMDKLPEAGQRVKAAKFLANHASSGSELKQEAAAKLAQFQELSPNALRAATSRLWHNLHHHHH